MGRLKDLFGARYNGLLDLYLGFTSVAINLTPLRGFTSKPTIPPLYPIQ